MPELLLCMRTAVGRKHLTISSITNPLRILYDQKPRTQDWELFSTYCAHMSSTEADGAVVNGSKSHAASAPELDIEKLHALPSEQQDLFLLTFVTGLCRHIFTLDNEEVTNQQTILKREVFKIITLPTPSPTRIIRNNLGRSLARIFEKGDRKLLYETINELQGIINGGKGEKELQAKHAAAHCLGEVFGAAGDSAISLTAVVCSTFLRFLKSAQNHAGLRSSIYKALGKVVGGVGSSLDEATAKDIWKQARSAASGDKSHLVQASACRALESLIINTSYFDNSTDYDALKSTIWKTIESSAPSVRHAAASCLAASLVKNFTEDSLKISASKSKKSKKSSKRQSMAVGAEDEEIERPGTPSGRRQAIQLAFDISDLLNQLSTQYARISTTNKARAGIVCCYKYALQRLGERVVEGNFSRIVDHFFNDLLSHSYVTSNRYRLLLTRRFVKIILEDVVCSTLLGEAGQLSAAKSLLNDVLKNYPQVITERPEPSKHALTAALSTLSSLLSCLGSAANVFSDTCREVLSQVLKHPSYTVQIYTSHCMRSLVLACPSQLLGCVELCMQSLTTELDNLSGPKPSSRRCIGFANGLAATLATSRVQQLYGSVDVYSKVLNLATDLLKSSSKSELRRSATQIQVAWILIGGLMPLGPNFVKIHLSQLLLMWRNALPKPLTKDNMAQQNPLELSFLTHVRECALGSILVFLEYNSKLLTADGSKRVAVLLQNTTLFLDSLPSRRTSEEISQRLSPSLQLYDLMLMVRRRIFQCFTKLANVSHLESTDVLSQSNILNLAASSFSDPDAMPPLSLASSAVAMASNSDNVWEVGDNWGFGITGLLRGFHLQPLPGEQGSESSHINPNGQMQVDSIDANVRLSERSLPIIFGHLPIP